MDRTRVILSSLLFFFFGAVTQGALGQAAAEAGLVHGLSSVSNASAASRVSAATNRALEGHKTAGVTVSRPAASRAVPRTRPAGSQVSNESKTSNGSTTRGHSGVATATGSGAKLPDGVAHVWPEGALTKGAPQ